jgi:hypothetical protein
MKIALLTVLACLFATTAMANRIKGDAYVGCITEEALDEFMTAAMNNDLRQIETLIGVTCAQISGLEYSMIDRGILRSKVRVYFGNDSVVLYTVAEAAR